MKNTTLCYIEKEDSYLLLHRTKKGHDFNKDKWIGVGGKFEDKESPEECLLREVKEETGLDLISWRWHGIVTFVSDEYPTEYMYLYTSSDYTGSLIDCDEGELEWVPKSRIFELPIWPGDRIFLHLMQTGIPFFSLKLVYRKDRLIAVKLNHRELSPEEIGENIKKWSALRGMSIKGLAEKAGLSRSSILNLREGRCISYMPTYQYIAEALGVTVGTLLGETGGAE